jgi:hypothetical protein
MELHDYRLNAAARQGETLRRFNRAEAIGVTRRGPARRGGWFGGRAPQSTARTTRAGARDLQHES